MVRLGGLKFQTYIKILNWFGWPLIVTYLASMIVIPFFRGGGDWHYVQDVWDRWQGVNVGMLALIASIIAFTISRYKIEDERKRNFSASRAFLPQELSELTGYCTASMALFAEAWPRAHDSNDRCKTPLKTTTPDLPGGYKEVFRDCIKNAEPDVGDFLSNILMRLQIHHTRLKGLVEEFQPNSSMIVRSENITSYLLRIAEIQALINKIFDFARGQKDFEDSPLEWEDYRNALSVGGIWISNFEGLEGFIKRFIARKQKG